MSRLEVVNSGEEAFLDLILAVGYTLRLFKNDATAGLTAAQIDALTAAAFTEADFAGYASAALTGGSWTTTPDDPSTAVYAAQTFTRSSTGTAQLIYGYYVTLTSSGALRWFEQFDGPVSIEFASDALTVTPAITLDEGETVPTGQITAFGGTTAPTGWLLCDGSAVSRTTQAALFAAIGTTFGVGDGSTTFNVPDLRQRVPLGKAAAGTGSTLGATGGSIDHTHSLDTATAHARISLETNVIHEHRVGATAWTENVTGTTTTGSASTSRSLATKLAGDTDSDNMPFQVVNFIIKT